MKTSFIIQLYKKLDDIETHANKLVIIINEAKTFGDGLKPTI